MRRQAKITKEQLSDREIENVFNRIVERSGQPNQITLEEFLEVFEGVGAHRTTQRSSRGEDFERRLAHAEHLSVLRRKAASLRARLKTVEQQQRLAGFSWPKAL